MRRRLAQARDVELLKQRIEIGLAAAAVRLDDFEHGADIVFDIEAAEDRGFLRQIADAEAGALIHRQRGDVVAVELDAAAVGVDQAGDHVEHRGLAGAVGPEQAHRFAAPHVKRDAFDDRAAAEAFLDAVRGEIAVACSLPAVGVVARPRCGGLWLAAGVGCARLHLGLAARLARPRSTGVTPAAGAAWRRNSERIFTGLPRGAEWFATSARAARTLADSASAAE